VPKCRTTAPNVLFYGPLGALEKPYLPTGAISTTVDDAKWRSMSKTDFAKYDMIVLGAPDDGGFSYTTYAMMQAAFETRNVWGPAVNGRIVVLGLDPAFHASKGTAGAITFQKASLAWLATGGAGQTTLFVNTDWGNRKLDFLSPFGAFSSTSQASDKIVISKTTHPIMIGSTDATLSNWYGSAHSFVTFPSPFTSLANGTDTAGAKGEVVVVRDYACVP